VPTSPFKTIITIASMVSRASEDPPWPVYITAAIIIISMPLMESVSTSVPKASPSRTASHSAWRTTANAETRIAVKSHPSRKANQTGSERSASHRFPNTKKSAVVAMLTGSGHSVRTREISCCVRGIVIQVPGAACALRRETPRVAPEPPAPAAR